MNKKAHPIPESPDIQQLQAVVIDHRTRIYIAKDADPVLAKENYLLRHGGKML